MGIKIICKICNTEIFKRKLKQHLMTKKCLKIKQIKEEKNNFNTTENNIDEFVEVKNKGKIKLIQEILEIRKINSSLKEENNKIKKELIEIKSKSEEKDQIFKDVFENLYNNKNIFNQRYLKIFL